VMTITFILISSLPVVDQLTAHYGPPPQRGRTWLYDNPIPCSLLNASQKGECTNPYYIALLDKLGLNLPLPEQWAGYMYRALTFQWGTVDNHSTAGTTAANGLAAGHPVITVLSWFLPYTLELALLSLAIILAVSIPLGNLSAVYRNRPVDQAARIMSFSGYAMPSFLLASLLLMALVLGLGGWLGFGVHPPWCPSGESTYDEFVGSWPIQSCFAGGNYPSWLVQGAISSPTGFPTVDAAIHGQWWLAIVRNSMLEVMNLDFVRTARAKGVPESTVIKRHAGRNSLNVTITVLGLTFAFFIGGFPVIEEVFGLHGVGYLLALSVQQTNYPIDFGLIFGSVLLFTYIVVVANIIVDVLYAYLDPRVRLG
ncbi:MAG: ABC transporter permease, partial [Thermoplasmata archaeon]